MQTDSPVTNRNPSHLAVTDCTLDTPSCTSFRDSGNKRVVLSHIRVEETGRSLHVEQVHVQV